MAGLEPGSVVCVTGSTGFIGSHVVEQLVRAGYRVRAVVRNPDDAEKNGPLLRFVAEGSVTLWRADLMEEGSFDAAFEGVDAVVHTAAVVELGRVGDPQREVVDPSVTGVSNVLQSVQRNSHSVRYFIHTSSVAAIHQRHRHGILLDETCWNDWATLASDPYGYAKTEAEKLVWEFAKKHARKIRVRALNPCVVLGPVKTKAHTKSSTIFLRESIYNNPVPPIWACYVDVRDVGLAHVRALQLVTDEPHRFVLASDSPSMQASELGAIAQRELPQYQLRTPPKYSPMIIWLLVILSYIPVFGRFVLNPLERSALTWRERLNNEKAKRMLKLKFRPLSETCRDGVISIIEGGYVKPKPRN